MSKVTYRMSGLKEMEAALRALPSATRRQVALKVLREGGEPIAKRARELAPVDQGYLREGINVGTNLSSSQRIDKGAVAAVEMHVGPGQHPQAIMQEFGTYKEPPQPFLRPAWDAMRVRALDIIGTLLGIEIDKAAKRLASRAARK